MKLLTLQRDQDDEPCLGASRNHVMVVGRGPQDRYHVLPGNLHAGLVDILKDIVDDQNLLVHADHLLVLGEAYGERCLLLLEVTMSRVPCNHSLELYIPEPNVTVL